MVGARLGFNQAFDQQDPAARTRRVGTATQDLDGIGVGPVVDDLRQQVDIATRGQRAEEPVLDLRAALRQAGCSQRLAPARRCTAQLVSGQPHQHSFVAVQGRLALVLADPQFLMDFLVEVLEQLAPLTDREAVVLLVAHDVRPAKIPRLEGGGHREVVLQLGQR